MSVTKTCRPLHIKHLGLVDRITNNLQLLQSSVTFGGKMKVVLIACLSIAAAQAGIIPYAHPLATTTLIHPGKLGVNFAYTTLPAHSFVNPLVRTVSLGYSPYGYPFGLAPSFYSHGVVPTVFAPGPGLIQWVPAAAPEDPKKGDKAEEKPAEEAKPEDKGDESAGEAHEEGTDAPPAEEQPQSDDSVSVDSA